MNNDIKFLNTETKLIPLQILKTIILDCMVQLFF